MNKNIFAISVSVIGLLTCSYAIADQSCAYYPNTDRPDEVGKQFIRMRDSGPVYTQVGESEEIRVDTQTIDTPKVSYYYNDNPAQYSTGSLTPFAVDYARFFNGHASRSYTFDKLGVQTIYASQEVDVIVDYYYPCPNCDLKPIWGKGVICAAKKFIVQNKPEINISTVDVNKESINIETYINVDNNAKAYAQGMQPLIRYSYKNMIDPRIRGDFTTSNLSQSFNPEYRGEYEIIVSVYDGVYTSKHVSQKVFFPWGKVPIAIGR
jgi:hypothetical protein